MKKIEAMILILRIFLKTGFGMFLCIFLLEGYRSSASFLCLATFLKKVCTLTQYNSQKIALAFSIFKNQPYLM